MNDHFAPGQLMNRDQGRETIRMTRWHDRFASQLV